MSAPATAVEALRVLVRTQLQLGLPQSFDRSLKRGLDAAAPLVGARGDWATCAALASLAWTEPAWQAVIEAITVRETAFFRQRTWWQSVVREVLVPLVASRRRDGSRRISCLSVGCASGEEPYSLAMALDRLIGGEPGWNVGIVGLDVCGAALDAAREGAFGSRTLAELPPEERERWFRPAGRSWQLDGALRERVGFQLFNLASAMADPGAPVHGAPADVVICRNVLIHIAEDRRPAAAAVLRRLVAPGGALVVAPVEANAAWFAPLACRTVDHAVLFSVPRPELQEEAVPPPVPPPDPPVRPRVHRVVSPTAAAGGDGPPQPRAGLARARRLADLGLFEEARRVCERALPRGPEGDLLMALVCQALGDLDAARAAAQRGLAAAPDLAAAHYVAAVIALRGGRKEEARLALGNAVRLAGDADDGEPLGPDLGIEAGHIRQAARRLGIVHPAARRRHGRAQ